jgi:hypothetical protein
MTAIVAAIEAELLPPTTFDRGVPKQIFLIMVSARIGPIQESTCALILLLGRHW